MSTPSTTVLKPENPEESSIVVFGAGAVGMAAVFGAAAAKIKTIIVVDILENRLELAKTLGATHSINGKTGTSTFLANVIGTMPLTSPFHEYRCRETSQRAHRRRVRLCCRSHWRSSMHQSGLGGKSDNHKVAR